MLLQRKPKNWIHAAGALLLAGVAVEALAAKSIEAKGSALIQGGKQATEMQFARAKLDAFADGLRKLAIGQTTNVISHSLLGQNGELHESVFVQSSLPLRHIEVTDESRLGGVYQVAVRAFFEDANQPATAGGSPRCAPENPPLRREISVQIDNGQLPTQALDGDVNGAMIAARAAIAKKIRSTPALLFVNRARTGDQEAAYWRSHLVSKRQANEQVLTVSVVSDAPGPEHAFWEEGQGGTEPAGSTIRIALPTGKYLTKPLQQGSLASLKNPSASTQTMNAWLDRVWPEIERALSCLPLAAQTRPTGTKELHISLGEEHGLVEGQQLVLLDERMRLRMQSTHSQHSKIGLYTVGKVSKYHALIHSAIDALPMSSSGKKIVIPF